MGAHPLNPGEGMIGDLVGGMIVEDCRSDAKCLDSNCEISGFALIL